MYFDFMTFISNLTFVWITKVSHWAFEMGMEYMYQPGTFIHVHTWLSAVVGLASGLIVQVQVSKPYRNFPVFFNLIIRPYKIDFT